MKRHRPELLAALAVLSCDAGEIADRAASPPGAAGTETQLSELSSRCACSRPTSGLQATFRVGVEAYQQQITDPSAIADAIALWRGKSNKRVPVGTLGCQCRGWNCEWRWFVDPSTIQFAMAATEVCDGIPSYVDAHCATFGKFYCPFNAKMTELRDCRTDPSCPLVSR